MLESKKIFIFLKIRAHFIVRLYSDAVYYISVKYTKSPDSIPLEDTIKHSPLNKNRNVLVSTAKTCPDPNGPEHFRLLI